jgi:hypothetical protein
LRNTGVNGGGGGGGGGGGVGRNKKGRRRYRLLVCRLQPKTVSSLNTRRSAR